MMRAAGWAAVTSGVTSAIGIVFLILMFASFGVGARPTGMTFGWINDVLVLVSYLLAAPVVVAIHQRLRIGASPLGRLGLVVGLGAIVAVVVLQWLLVSGGMTFEEQFAPVSVALLLFGAWLVATGAIASSRGILPDGTRLGIAAALYLGYPLWALRVARALREDVAPDAIVARRAPRAITE